MERPCPSPVDTYELEWVVEDLYRRAGAQAGDVWAPSELARRILGREAIVLVRGLAPRALLAEVDEPSGWVVRVRRGLPLPIEEWSIGHELAHLAGVVDERAADYIGAAIQMRRAPFLVAMAEHGEAWHELAERFGTTSTSAALRAAELEQRALAVVTPQRVYARHIHAAPEEVRALARHGGPGIRRARLEDAPKRIVLEADEETG